MRTQRAAMDACIKASLWQKALSLHLESDDQSSALVARALARGVQWQSAIGLLTRAPASKLLTDVLGALARAGQWQHACALLFSARAMSATRELGKAVSLVTSACGEASRWETALAVLSCSSQIRVIPDRLNFNAGMSACARGAQWHQALQLLWDLDRRMGPDVASFSIAITACEKGGRMEDAAQLMGSMSRRTLALDAVGFGACISACEKSSRWDQALQILHAALSAGHADFVSYNTAMSSCEKASCWEHAVDLLSQAVPGPVGPVGYGSVLSSLRLCGAWRRALELAAKGRGALDAVCLEQAILCLEATGQPQSPQLLRQMLKRLSQQLAIAARPGGLRAYAASTGALELCRSFGLRAEFGAFAARAKAKATEGSALCDLGRFCTRDALNEQRCSEKFGLPKFAAGFEAVPLQATAREAQATYCCEGIQDVRVVEGIFLQLAAGVVQQGLCKVRYEGSTCKLCPSQNLLCGASDCYRSAMNITWREEALTSSDSYYEALAGAVLDKACLDVIKQATSPVDAIIHMSTAAADTSTAVGQDCKTFHCRVLQNALYLQSDLENKGDNCTDTYGAKSSSSLSCPCETLLSDIGTEAKSAIDSICGVNLLLNGCSYYEATPSYCNTTGRRLDSLDELPCGHEADVTPRMLQATSNDAPAWTVGQWSSCQCYDQCMPGMMTRIVTCGGTTCRGEMPARRQACTCDHCAFCDAAFIMQVLMIVQFVQAGIAFVLSPSMAYFGSLPEESLIKLGIWKSLAGIFCRMLPVLELLGDFASLLGVLWLVTITFVPPIFQLEFMKDCFPNPVLRAATLVPLILCLVRLVLGRCARRYTRVPPQLYTPSGKLPPGLRHLWMMIRCLGPDNALNIEHFISDKRSGLDFGVVTPRKSDSDKLATNRLVKDQRIFSNGNSYVGTWLSGRMHGEGHYIWSDGSEFFGEFHEGYMWGNGKKTWPTGRTYDGEWRKDQMWGEGKMTWPSGEEYIGSLKKGVFHGKGTRTWPNGDRYAGSFKHGMQEGEGTFESAEEGWVYSGQWLQNRMNGRGKVKWPNGIEYDGDWKDGIREGKGKLTWADGSCYKGEFQHNCIEGKGKKTLPDGSWFEGQFHDSELEGRGTFHWPDGTEFEGLWHNSEIVGPGCHRFPNGTMITGVFENHGATGEGTKKWANGSVYTGTLLNNSIHKYGVFQWPDGRRYIGQFQDEMMHGEGMLCWSDDFGVCRYKGTFEHNVFQGHGVVEWSVKARYVGEFFNGLYHGEGTFEWPDKANVYRGQWQFGEMSGKGTLTTSCGSIYSGEFHAGNLEGRGTITFITNDQYTGEFKESMFNGLGCYTWSSGVTLTGVFENNLCSKVGKKTYTNGLVYVGEFFEDQEHGRGVLTDAFGTRVVGVWNSGKLEEELIEMLVSAPEVDPRGPPEQRVFVASRRPDALTQTLPEAVSSSGSDCKSIVLFTNGDKYVGGLRNGQKDGEGMYVYVDGSAYKGTWAADALAGEEVHPQAEAESEQTRRLHELNTKNAQAVLGMKAKLPGERKQVPPVARIQD
ncbi:unnamed protein product [Effrenium voratum]|uniref:Pentatricopeptide repeat-containing protein, chloroplastic n=1 Tax=Effrenium voratum TaxID=2562239 RepID=A0AA36JGH3_9DINO|nr:unnamed protein product [Effrenium voratum]